MANEKRLIDADDAVKLLRGKCVAKYPNTFMMGLFASADEISKMPTVDAVEVVHGRWVKVDHYPPECSICGDIAPLTCDGEAHYMGNYCPNCGAYMMDGGNEGVV